MIYEWKDGTIGVPAKAQSVGRRLEKIRRLNGGELKPLMIVKDACSPSSPLHSCFEWNNEIAAAKYRITQANYMIRHIVVRLEDRPEAKPIRAFVSVRKDDSRHYTSIGVAMSDEEYRKQVIQEALEEAKEWRERYENYKELGEIFKAIDKTVKVFA